MTGGQAHRRRAPRRSRRLRERGVDAVLCWSATAPTATTSSGARSELGIVRNCLFLGYQEDVAPLLRGLRRACPPVGERGNAGQRDRGARGGTAGRRDARRRRPRRRPRRRRRLPRRAGRRRGARRPPRPARRDPELRRRMGEAGRERCSRATPSSASIDDVDALYRRLLAEKGIPTAWSLLERGEGRLLLARPPSSAPTASPR